MRSTATNLKIVRQANYLDHAANNKVMIEFKAINSNSLN